MMIIENMHINIHSDTQPDSPDIVMSNPDFRAGYEQAINSREFRANRFFTDADIVGIIQDFQTEKVDHDEAELQWHAGQITGLIAVRCLASAYPQVTDEHAPLQGQPYAPVSAPQQQDLLPGGVSLMIRTVSGGYIDADCTYTSDKDMDLELSYVSGEQVDVTPDAVMHLPKQAIVMLRDFLNQAQITAWLAS